MSYFNSPLRYPGGKNCIFRFVSKMFYENDLVGISYAEPYAGGAGLALRLLFEGYVSRIYINDLDWSIYSFWKTILSRPDDFCDWIEEVDVSLRNWTKFKAMQSDRNCTQFELAMSTFFLNRTNVSGVIKGGVIGGQDQKGKYKIDARFNKKELIERIQRVAAFKNQIVVSNVDGISLINRLNRKQEEIFIYLDPPYVEKAADLYMNYYKHKDHERLSKHVAKLNKPWMVSYDKNEFVFNLYAEQKKVIYKLAQGTSNKVGDEVLIFADGIKYRSSAPELREPIFVSKWNHLR